MNSLEDVFNVKTSTARSKIQTNNSMLSRVNSLLVFIMKRSVRSDSGFNQLVCELGLAQRFHHHGR